MQYAMTKLKGGAEIQLNFRKILDRNTHFFGRAADYSGLLDVMKLYKDPSFPS